jgi:Zn-dependent peptidase ImmA (M78 family)
MEKRNQRKEEIMIQLDHIDKASRAQADQSVFGMLRALVPQRQLTSYETLRIAELQANRLLHHFDIETPTVPEEIVSELPRIRVVRERLLPVSGSAHWNGRYWIISINADDHPFRQRFSMMHEFKHVLDHTTRQFLYEDTPYRTAHEQAERVADAFAAFLLMPKRVVKALWCQRHQNIEQLALLLEVSPQALRYRLDQLGLTERSPRCSRPITSSLARPSARRPFIPARTPISREVRL